MSNEATHRNILAIKAHSEETRALVRQLEVKLGSLDMLISKMNLVEDQLGNLQVKIFSGGATV